MCICKQGCPYVCIALCCCIMVHMLTKITSPHALCRAQDRGGDISSPACNNLAVLSVQSIACCSNQVGTGAVLVVCMASSKTFIACRANIADDTSCTLVHALLLNAWLFGCIVSVISNNCRSTGKSIT
jgi:hypothetical protein